MIRRTVYMLVILVLSVSSCRPAATTEGGNPTVKPPPTGILTPYLTFTPRPELPTATIDATIPVTPTPSPTPFLYTVKGDDTMLGIAIRYGISLEALKTANPTVDPHYMGEGLKLVIPIIQSTPEAQLTPTTVVAAAVVPSCYRTGDGGAWCVTAIMNQKENSLENLAVLIGLFDDQGKIISSQMAYAPMNILRPGDRMPLMAYFSPPLPDDFQAQANVTGALEVQPNDSRYIDATTKIDSTEISSGGNMAVIKGEVILPEDAPKLSQLWVLAVAYDAMGNIIGERKWKSDGETSFEIPVYSLSGAIDHVETLVEARS